MSDLDGPNFTELPSSNITVGPIRVDTPHLQVSVDGKTTSLTGLEGYILHFLAVHANTVCTFSQIGSHICGTNNDGNTILIKVSILHLRHKVESDPSHPIYILTVPGVGYMLVSHDLDEAR
jgi:DNA-binding response OmpR family regulator